MSAALPVQQFLAFDWGRKRIGVASGNTLTQQASRVLTLSNRGVVNDAQLERAIKNLVRQWRPHALVLGVPYHPDGAPHKNTQYAKQFAQYLRDWTQLAVHEVDERYSTTQAKADNPSASQDALDEISACIILEQYMRSLS